MLRLDEGSPMRADLPNFQRCILATVEATAMQLSAVRESLMEETLLFLEKCEGRLWIESRTKETSELQSMVRL